MLGPEITHDGREEFYWGRVLCIKPLFSVLAETVESISSHPSVFFPWASGKGMV